MKNKITSARIAVAKLKAGVDAVGEDEFSEVDCWVG